MLGIKEQGKLNQQVVLPVRLVFQSITTEYRCIRAAQLRQYPNQTTPGTESSNKMDTLANTCCFGENWTPIYFTGDQVEVSPFVMVEVPVNERCPSCSLCNH